MLVKEGDDGYRNFALLLNEMRGHEMIPQRIHEAMGRLDHRVGRQLAYVTKQKPKAEADPHYRPGQFIEPSQPLWKQDRDRREREAAEKNQASKPQLSGRVALEADGR